MRKNYVLLLALVASGLYAQTSVQIVDNYLRSNSRGMKTSSTATTPILEYKVVTDNTVGDNIGEYVKVQQTINGIPVYQGFGTFQIKNKKVLHANLNFQEEFPVNKEAGLSPNQAIQKFANKISKRALLVNDLEALSHSTTSKMPSADILYSDKNRVLNYVKTKDGLRLAWIMLASIRTGTNKDLMLPLYEAVIDANSGELITKNSVVNECFIDPMGSSKSIFKNSREDYEWIYEGFAKPNTGYDATSGTYRVIPANYQSPLRHPFSLISNASDPVASKEGWHKLIPVARDPSITTPLTKYHTIGNNVRVSSDTEGVASDIILNSSGLLASLAPMYLHEEAYGGPDLMFDFPNPGSSTDYDPLKYTSASATQMFYSINAIHDILYYHGFNPKAGSFQVNSGEGALVTGITNTGLGKTRTVNNAFMAYSMSFITNPVTCFFTFETLKEGAGVFDVNDGIYKGTYGGAVGNNPLYKYGVDPAVTGDMVLVDDGAGANHNDSCEEPINGNQLQDKIVLVDRGTCPFTDKVAKIAPYKPKAIVILNNSTTTLTGSLSIVADDDSRLTFPVVAIDLAIAKNLKQTLSNGNAPSITVPSLTYKITKRDSGFDSQVILHEYTHAVSGRITGGAMGGEEGMNEGWSDYVALNLTQQANQTGADQIEMGNYAFSGGGLRPKPYTTDMSINPHTYDYLKEIGAGENLQHPTGYLWAVMLWEMHWKFVEKYGFNPDFKSSKGGNNMALDLVLQGQKMQVPNPGFVEGRDAILQADQLFFNGDNKCMIWQAFAKRGLGLSAIQGTSASRIDGTEAFDLPSECQTLATTEVNAGSTVSIYPNPAKDVVYVMAKEEVLKAEIFDIAGRLISTQVINIAQQKRSIDTSALSKGVYIVKFITKEGAVTKKIIKN